MKNIKVCFQPFNHTHNYLNINSNRLKVTVFNVTFNHFQPLSTSIKIYVLSTYFFIIYL